MSVQAFLLRPKRVPVKGASKPRVCNTRWLTHRRQGEDCGIRGAAEGERDEAFQNQSVMVDATQSEALWTLVTLMSRTPLPFPLSCVTTGDRYGVLTGENTCEQALWGETVAAAHIRNHKKKQSACSGRLSAKGH